MNTKLYFDYAGVSFRVDADIYDDEGQGVEQVNEVQVKAANGDFMVADVDLDAFKDDMQDWLDEAAHNYFEDVKNEYYENLMDERRLEERLKK